MRQPAVDPSRLRAHALTELARARLGVRLTSDNVAGWLARGENITDVLQQIMEQEAPPKRPRPGPPPANGSRSETPNRRGIRGLIARVARAVKLVFHW